MFNPNPYEPGTPDHDGFEFFKLVNAEWPFKAEKDAENREISAAADYLRDLQTGAETRNEEFLQIIRPEWSFDDMAEAIVREQAEAAAHLAFVDWLRS